MAGARDRFSGTYSLTPNGYAMRRKLLFRHPVPLQTFRNDPADPLTFHTAEGDRIQPFRTFDGYDRGTVPLILRPIVEPDFGELTTLNHDSAFEFKAWWRNGAMEPVTMAQANHMLYRMARAEFRQARPEARTRLGRVLAWFDDMNNRKVAGLAWAGVMAGGWFAWRKTDGVTAENRRRIGNVEAALAAGAAEPGEEGRGTERRTSNAERLTPNGGRGTGDGMRGNNAAPQ